MSSEIHVLFRGKLPHLTVLSRTMGELGFPFKIRYAAGSMEDQCGFMPMWLRREETGVEFQVFDGRSTVEELAGKNVDPAFDRTGSFRWSGDEDEMLAGLCAAAALARLVDGTVLEEHEDRLLSADEAIALARETLQTVLKPRRPRAGTRPADIKRYLKPLLKERSDLVVVDRLVLIRPVRHILRGALFDRSSSRYRFRIWSYVQDLCHADGGGVGYGDYSFGLWWDVWQPHFEPALMDVLAEDVFEHVGRITTLADLAAELIDNLRPLYLQQLSYTQKVTMLLLAGERDRAAEHVRQIESHDPAWGEWAEAQRNRLADVDAVCAEFHAREARAAKAMKIEHIWEPSPFPVELPAAAQAAAADPLFVPKPWIPRPAWLLQELPEQVGDVRFAKDSLLRKGRTILVATLSREQAEERHRNGEPYVLAARLSDGLALVLCGDGEDRKDPDRHPLYVSLGGLTLTLYGSDFVVRTTFSQSGDDARMLDLRSIDVDYPTRYSIWSWMYTRRNADEITIDYRGAEREYSRRNLTDADMDQLTCPKPEFGEFDVLVALLRKVLRSKDYGEI